MATERYVPPPWQRRRSLPAAEPAQSAVGGGRSAYRLGRDFERAIRGRLERRGYFVQRSALSKGKVDLLAVGPLCVAVGISGLFIQAKRRGVISSEEWNALYDIATKHAGWAVLVKRESERTVGFYRLDAVREPRRQGRPWTMIDVGTLAEMLPPPTLL